MPLSELNLVGGAPLAQALPLWRRGNGSPGRHLHRLPEHFFFLLFLLHASVCSISVQPGKTSLRLSASTGLEILFFPRVEPLWFVYLMTSSSSRPEG